jgi:hypothetical protein
MIIQGMSAMAFSEGFFNFGLLCPLPSHYIIFYFFFTSFQVSYTVNSKQ